ncbi:MAG: type I-U CRISPR-associated protein Cas5/Cas6 [Rhodothermaceae bacterium]|nr:type I-U CRISPR-associated protein Cas5/Cas6 [Rhodothermaceae bacterium]MXZ18167.1 type I-U CRISPR-associated protein Cas5/Cas6 [Rhodothermaceae bacterium]MYG68795.1 type I-U CRISPR-associated protein Cas5/Cas6 [Rhodothermaceae bacterium]MYJ45064.1 type I-U CRISPR-associated protein Cas5/Cas6 [Rhodothermaceae bacterium]
MLAISVELLHATFRGDPQGTANTGQLLMGEWPPSPMRLFAALVAADGTRENCCATDGSELDWFERLPPPTIYAESLPIHQPLWPRYVVRYRETGAPKKLSRQQEYINRESTLVRPGVRVSPRSPKVVYRWEVEIPNTSIFIALKRRAARIGYLGTSDSPVRMQVSDDSDLVEDKTNTFVPDDRGDVYINIAKHGDLQILDNFYDQWKQHGPSISRSQFPALGKEVCYRSPSPIESTNQGKVVAWLRLGQAISGRRVSVVTHLFKQSVLSQYQQLFGGPPNVLHGHGFDGKGYELARFLALPDVGYRRSRGRIHGMALWMPPESGPIECARSRDAAFAVRQLTGKAINVSVEPHIEPHRGGDRPLAANSWRWRDPSQVWVTAFPAIHERHRAVDLNEISRWCCHAGLPEPIDFRSSRTPLVMGAVDLAPVEVNRPNRPVLPYSHIWIRFAQPISGPIVIGSGRQRGFGLCIPLNKG